MRKPLFLIHDLGQGDAEKVLVNLVNHLDRSKFDISVAVFPREVPGNSKLMKLLTPEQLHAHCVIVDSGFIMSGDACIGRISSC